MTGESRLSLLLSRFRLASLALAPVLVVISVLVAHRLWLYMLLGGHFDALAVANPEHYTWQLLRFTHLRDHLWTALLVLQQSPPLSNVVVGLMAQWVDGPVDLARSLLALETVITLGVSALLYDLMRRSLGWRWRGVAVAIVFGVGADFVFMEYDNLGHDFYEFMTMAIVAALAVLLHRAVSKPSVMLWAAAGALATATALTRSSYSYLDLFLIVVVCFAPLKRRGRYLLAFVVPILLLHGGWSLKNLWVYDHWQWATSSWGGSNAVSGLKAGGVDDVFLADLLDHRDEYPEWFVDVVESNEVPVWLWNGFLRSMPSELRARDREIEQRFGLKTRIENTVSMRVMSDHYLDAFKGFALRNPEIMVERLRYGYKLYWFPIRYYTTNFLGLISPDWRVEPSMSPAQLIAMGWRGEMPEPVVLRSGPAPHDEAPITDLPVAGSLTIFTWYATFVLVHTVVPLVALWMMVQAARQRRFDKEQWFFLALLGIYAYAAGVHNIIEFRENMRFRLSVEPLIWWLSLASLVYARPLAVRCYQLWRRVGVSSAASV